MRAQVSASPKNTRESNTNHSGIVYARMPARPDGSMLRPAAESMFQPATLQSALATSRGHSARGTTSDTPALRL